MAWLRRVECFLTGGHRWRCLSSFYDVRSGVEWFRVECARCGVRDTGKREVR